VKLKSSKDLAAFQAATKKLNADYKTETQAISDLANSLKGSDAADKVAELQKQDRYEKPLRIQRLSPQADLVHLL
jgi:hypothetical protein